MKSVFLIDSFDSINLRKYFCTVRENPVKVHIFVSLTRNPMPRKSGFLTVLSYLYGAILRLAILIFRLSYYSLVLLLVFLEGVTFVLFPSVNGDGMESIDYISEYYLPFELTLRNKFGKRI